MLNQLADIAPSGAEIASQVVVIVGVVVVIAVAAFVAWIVFKRR
jgi:succinate dehydrogenase/fumarate reductase cytochrome b subunit